MEKSVLLQRIHPFKRKQVERVASDELLRESCSELWVFGSAVCGASEKRHDARSDVDFAILPLDTDSPDIDTPSCRRINERLMDDLTVDGQFTEYDVVWFNRQPSKELVANVHRGLRVF